MNELYRSRQIEFVLTHSRARALIVSREVLDNLPRPVVSNAEIIVLEDIGNTDVDFIPVASDPTASAQITYTSGSTGQPKGVLMSHENLWAGVRVVANYLGLRGDDRIAGLLAFSFVYGFNQLTTALFVGATLVVERSSLPQDIVATLRRERVTVACRRSTALATAARNRCVPRSASRSLAHRDKRGRPTASVERSRTSTCTAAGKTVPNVRANRSLPKYVPPARRSRQPPGFNGSGRPRISGLRAERRGAPDNRVVELQTKLFHEMLPDNRR